MAAWLEIAAKLIAFGISPGECLILAGLVAQQLRLERRVTRAERTLKSITAPQLVRSETGSWRVR